MNFWYSSRANVVDKEADREYPSNEDRYTQTSTFRVSRSPYSQTPMRCNRIIIHHDDCSAFMSVT